MTLSFPYEVFFRSKNTAHFLLDEAKLNIQVFLNDNSVIRIDAVKASAFKGFVVELTPDLLPDDPTKPISNPPVKKTINKIQVNYITGTTFEGVFFRTLEIKQVFRTIATATYSNTNIDYVLSPSFWIDSLGNPKVANMGTHPLLNTREIPKNKIYLNALVVDLTELWMRLHKDNTLYNTLLKYQSADDKITFKVFANLSGNAFIWFATIPKYLSTSEIISPHVFFSPSDHADHQNRVNDKEYLLNNASHFQRDGDILFKYLLPPTDDILINTLKNNMADALLKATRNVVSFDLAKDNKTISPKHWNIRAGFQKAFYGLNGKNPQQIFLMPQDFGTGHSSIKGIQTLGPSQALKQITDSIFDVLLTNTDLVGRGKEPVIKKDKLILSCYSESGFDLWITSLANLKNLKAVIAIEPQNMNRLTNGYGMKVPIGKEVLPKLIQQKVAIFLIGRHHLPKYKPEGINLTKLNLLPSNPSAIFQYPPDPASNDFVRYRVERIADLAKDPFSTLAEQKIIADLAKETPPVAGKDALKRVFGKLSNLDCSCGARGCACQQTGVSTWYSHSYALTGGQLMTLPKMGNIYNQPISYSTFFQEAVERIG